MGPTAPEPVTELLRWRAGDQGCSNRLVPQLEGELRRIAHRDMRMERQRHTLQTTALINEAYLKLVDQAHVDWQNRAQFLGLAAGIMRHILVDRAREVCRGKRRGRALPLDEGLVLSPAKSASWSRSTTRSTNSSACSRSRLHLKVQGGFAFRTVENGSLHH